MINLNRSRFEQEGLGYNQNVSFSHQTHSIPGHNSHTQYGHHGLNSSFGQVEPMHHSPIATSPDRVQYLPSFLMGDPGKSPKGKLRKEGGMGQNLDLSALGSSGLNVSGVTSPGQTSPGLGPTSPTGLFSSSASVAGGMGASTPKTTKNTGPPRTGLGSSSGGSAPAATPVAESPHGNWVTIFGFQPASQPLVLQTFATVGSVVEYKSIPGCNWMHVRYSSTIEARKALSKNACVIAGNIMIGVIKYEPQQQDVQADPVRTRIRPLASDNLVNQIPQRDSGLMSKVTEFFGW